MFELALHFFFYLRALKNPNFFLKKKKLTITSKKEKKKQRIKRHKRSKKNMNIALGPLENFIQNIGLLYLGRLSFGEFREKTIRIYHFLLLSTFPHPIKTSFHIFPSLVFYSSSFQLNQIDS